jgi:hypothetical protein
MFGMAQFHSCGDAGLAIRTSAHVDVFLLCVGIHRFGGSRTHCLLKSEESICISENFKTMNGHTHKVQ